MPHLPPCSFDAKARRAESLNALPAGVVAELRRFFSYAGPGSGLADAGGRYNSTDVIGSDTPSRRFLRAYRIGSLWIIWYERGGFVTGRQTIALRADAEQGATAWRAMPGSILSGNLCRATDALVAGVIAGTP